MRIAYDGLEIQLVGAGRITPDPDWNIGAHKHDQYEIHFITEGTGVNRLENGDMELYPGIVYMAPPHEVHAQTVDPHSPLGLYYVFFNLAYTAPWDPPSRIYAPFSFSSGELLAIFESINAPQGIFGFNNRMIGYMRLIEIIWRVLESRMHHAHMTASMQPIHPSAQSSVLLQKAILYIQQHFHRNPNVAEIADACYVSERHLSRMFLRQTNMTVNQFVQQERLFYASTELKHTTTPLPDICEKLHFSSMQYFAQWFKHLSSMTPAEFRKKHFGS